MLLTTEQASLIDDSEAANFCVALILLYLKQLRENNKTVYDELLTACLSTKSYKLSKDVKKILNDYHLLQAGEIPKIVQSIVVTFDKQAMHMEI